MEKMRARDVCDDDDVEEEWKWKNRTYHFLFLLFLTSFSSRIVLPHGISVIPMLVFFPLFMTHFCFNFPLLAIYDEKKNLSYRHHQSSFTIACSSHVCACLVLAEVVSPSSIRLIMLLLIHISTYNKSELKCPYM
ncbi:hypothetical protein F5B22DRAFT_273137 [Xylaria bambusicola]|uniref:uncharacterized protein n=1 Tax=Xylaria bambusicola TaxID=326684 RepID=UPI0020079736|nr:uncharacterized protein F5B22DRAFT_273137 [Xylaria bambusicola]KAI0513115.1 hypothetical protein F5B22DRAFT_273137 [Xylaria bambusicola]